MSLPTYLQPQETRDYSLAQPLTSAKGKQKWRCSTPETRERTANRGDQGFVLVAWKGHVTGEKPGRNWLLASGSQNQQATERRNDQIFKHWTQTPSTPEPSHPCLHSFFFFGGGERGEGERRNDLPGVRVWRKTKVSESVWGYIRILQSPLRRRQRKIKHSQNVSDFQNTPLQLFSISAPTAGLWRRDPGCHGGETPGWSARTALGMHPMIKPRGHGRVRQRAGARRQNLANPNWACAPALSGCFRTACPLPLINMLDWKTAYKCFLPEGTPGPCIQMLSYLKIFLNRVEYSFPPSPGVGGVGGRLQLVP